MKKALFYTFVCLLGSLCLRAQTPLSEKGQQVVYFVDGSMVKGVILSYHMNETLVMLVGGKEVELPADKVEYILRGRQAGKYEKDLKKEKAVYEYAFRERGLYNVSSISLNAGNDFEGTTIGLGVQQVVGYQINRWIGAGLGVGVDVYGLNSEKPFISVFGDVRGYLLAKKITPFYALQAGYGFLNDQRIRDAKGGLLIYPAVGIRLGGKAGANFSMDVGYKYQKSERQYDWWNGYEVWNYRYNRYVFRVSLAF